MQMKTDENVHIVNERAACFLMRVERETEQYTNDFVTLKSSNFTAHVSSECDQAEMSSLLTLHVVYTLHESKLELNETNFNPIPTSKDGVGMCWSRCVCV